MSAQMKRKCLCSCMLYVVKQRLTCLAQVIRGDTGSLGLDQALLLLLLLLLQGARWPIPSPCAQPAPATCCMSGAGTKAGLHKLFGELLHAHMAESALRTGALLRPASHVLRSGVDGRNCMGLANLARYPTSMVAYNFSGRVGSGGGSPENHCRVILQSGPVPDQIGHAIIMIIVISQALMPNDLQIPRSNLNQLHWLHRQLGDRLGHAI